MPKYTVLDKDTIKNGIMPYLSVVKRGYVSQGSLIEVVNAILHKLKSGCQWHQLPVEHLFGDVALSWNAICAPKDFSTMPTQDLTPSPSGVRWRAMKSSPTSALIPVMESLPRIVCSMMNFIRKDS